MTLIAETVGNTDETLLVEDVTAGAAGGAGVSYPVIPAGIGLQLGALGIVLGLLSCAYANLFNTAAAGIVIPVAFSVGAVAIFSGGIINFRAGIMVAGMIGVLYGAFWLSIGLLLQIDATPLVTAFGAKTFGNALGTYFLIWGIMSLGLCMPVAFVSQVVLAQEFLLSIVFFVLAAAEYTPGSPNILRLGGRLGIADALICFYISVSLVANETAGKPVIPLS